MSYASIIGLYAIAAALPAGLLVLYAIFRWRYLRLVKRTIYGDTDGLAGHDDELGGVQRNLAPLVLARTPKRLLLLRTFNQPAARGQLLNVLDDSWRRVGRIDLVVGTDLAIRTLGPLVLE